MPIYTCRKNLSAQISTKPSGYNHRKWIKIITFHSYTVSVQGFANSKNSFALTQMK